MSIIVKRATKGSALTSGEIDANVNNLNNDKVEINNSNFKAAPSLVNNLIPLTGTVLPAIYPSLNLDFANGKQLDPRITFSRNTVATYYDGKSVAVAEQNLFTYSQVFSSGQWSLNSGVILSNNNTAPDNSSTASLIVSTATTAAHYLVNNAITMSGVNTFSIYAKAGAISTISLWVSVVTSGVAYFDLSAGTVSSISTGAYVASAAIISVGNGWYRCSITTPSLVSASLYPVAGLGAVISYLGDGTSGAYFWGAQLEQRSSVTAYTPTTSSPITNYIPVLKTAASNVPRFDYDPLTKKCLGLLIEESRTNLLNYSSDFSNADWTKGSSTFYHNYVIAPDGTQTATLVGPTVSVQPYHSATWVPGVTYVYSVYVKAITGKTISFRMSGVTTGDELRTFTASTGTIIRGSGVDVGSETATLVGNGWYRVVMVSVARSNSSNYVSIEAGQGFAIWGAQLEVSGTTQAIRTSTIGVGSTTTAIVLDASASAVDGTYVGNKLTIANLARTITAYVGATKTATVSVAFASAPSSGTTYYITPATMVVGGFATSYIPTTTTALSRAADNASMTGTNFSSWYNQSQGTFVVEADAYSTGYRFMFTVITAASNNSISSLFRSDQQPSVYVNGVLSANLTPGTQIANTFGKLAWSQNGTVFTSSLNGRTPVTATSTAVIPTMDTLVIGGSSVTGGLQLNGHIKKLTYYPKALTAVELQGLTS